MANTMVHGWRPDHRHVMVCKPINALLNGRDVDLSHQGTYQMWSLNDRDHWDIGEVYATMPPLSPLSSHAMLVQSILLPLKCTKLYVNTELAI